MNFDELLSECLAMWPDTLDISDGYFTENEGFHSKHLIGAWEKAEVEAEPKGEWQELMTWILYQSLHRIAKANFLNQVYSFARESVEQEVSQTKGDLVENLCHPDYIEMLKEYSESNQ